MLKAFWKLYILFRKVKPDVVHTHLFDDSLPGLLAARLAGVRIRVITKQDTTFHWFYAPKGNKFDRFNNYNATYIVAVTKECEQFVLEKEKADKNKVSIVHHGIHIDKLTKQSDIIKKELINKYKLDGRKVIGTVARLIEWKGYRYIIEAAEIIVKKYPEITFLFIGSGDQEEELKDLIHKKGLDSNIIFTGWVEKDHIPSLYGIMDIYLHAASFEPFGFVIAEAMVNGIPVVSTSTGAAADAITHLENGYLFPFKDSKKMAEGVIYMIENDANKIGEKGRETACKMYDFDNMWNGYTKIYKSKENHK